jgi:hypothetical protein
VLDASFFGSGWSPVLHGNVNCASRAMTARWMCACPPSATTRDAENGSVS